MTTQRQMDACIVLTLNIVQVQRICSGNFAPHYLNGYSFGTKDIRFLWAYVTVRNFGDCKKTCQLSPEYNVSNIPHLHLLTYLLHIGITTLNMLMQ